MRSLKEICILLVLVLTGLFFAFNPITGSPTWAADLPPIEIPQIVDMTGPYKNESADWVKIGRAVETDINGKGGIRGRKINITYYDCRYDVGVSSSILSQLAQKAHKPPILCGSIGPFFIAAMPKLHEPAYGMVALGPVCYRAFAENPSWIFAFGALYEQSFGTFIDYQLKHWKEKRPIRVAYYTLNTAGGREPFNGIPWLESRGVEVVAKEFPNPVPVDISSIMMRFEQTKPDFIYGIAPGPAFAKLLTEIKRRNLNSKVVLPSFVPFSHLLQFVDKKTLEGHYMADSYNTYLDESSPGVKEMNAVFKKYIPSMWPPSTLHMWGWAHIHLAKDILEKTYDKVGSWDKVTGEEVYKLLSTKGAKFSTGGITADIEWGPGKRIGSRSIKILQCKDGEAVDVAGWLPIPKGLREEDIFKR